MGGVGRGGGGAAGERTPDDVEREHVEPEVRPRDVCVEHEADLGHVVAMCALDLQIVGHLHQVEKDVRDVVA